jgi:hypothetical protein
LVRGRSLDGIACLDVESERTYACDASRGWIVRD